MIRFITKHLFSRTSEAYFEAKYQKAPDPWGFASSSYEKERYSAILSALNGRRFVRAFEPGCSIGVLTEQLAAFSEHVEAIDISSTAVARAQERCLPLSNVFIRHGALPADIPIGSFDLLVFSEIGYYFEAGPLAGLVAELVSRLPESGTFLAAHWLGASRDHCLHGDEVHRIIGLTPGLSRLSSQCFSGFRLEQWTKA